MLLIMMHTCAMLLDAVHTGNVAHYDAHMGNVANVVHTGNVAH